MTKQIISVEKPTLKKSIKGRIDLPVTVEEERDAKISIDSRKQLFVRFPSIIAETAKITTENTIRFKVVAPLTLKNKKEIHFEMKLMRESNADKKKNQKKEKTPKKKK